MFRLADYVATLLLVANFQESGQCVPERTVVSAKPTATSKTARAGPVPNTASFQTTDADGNILKVTQGGYVVAGDNPRAIGRHRR